MKYTSKDYNQYDKILHKRLTKAVRLSVIEFDGRKNAYFHDVEFLGIPFMIMKRDISKIVGSIDTLELYYRVHDDAIHISSFSRAAHNFEKFANLRKRINEHALQFYNKHKGSIK